MFGRFARKLQHTGRELESPESALKRMTGECTLVCVVGPEDGGSVCTDWLGAVLDITGEDSDYPAFAEAVADGLFHDECRHSLEAYDPQQAGDARRAEVALRTAIARDACEARRSRNMPKADERVTRMYAWVRRADRAGLSAVSYALCGASLDMLGSGPVFDTKTGEVADLLRARMRTIARAYPARA